MATMTPEQRRERAVRARLALDDGTVTEVFTEIRADIHREWASARWPRTRERLHAELRALDRVTSRIATMAGQAPR